MLLTATPMNILHSEWQDGCSGKRTSPGIMRQSSKRCRFEAGSNADLALELELTPTPKHTGAHTLKLEPTPQLVYSARSVLGGRPYQEDTYCVKPNFASKRPTYTPASRQSEGDDTSSANIHLQEHTGQLPSESHKELSLAGVFDGHGGAAVSKFVADNITSCLVRALEETHSTTSSQCTDQQMKESIHRAFVAVDQQLPSADNMPQECGTTAAVAVWDDSNIYVGNCGESTN